MDAAFAKQPAISFQKTCCAKIQFLFPKLNQALAQARLRAQPRWMITSPNPPRYSPVGFSRTAIAGFLCLALTKIWLTNALPLHVAADADELTFLLQAHGLLAGHWLGPYTAVTLVKVPFYSMFLASSFLAGIPVLMAQQLVYVAACAFFLVAIRPAIPTWQTWRLLLLYAWLLFNPMSFLGGSRLLRNHLYASLGVLLIASALAVMIRIDWDAKLVFAWSVAFGIVLSAQWLTREESSWVLPFLLVNTFVTGWLMWRSCRDRWRRNFVLLALPYVLLGLSVLTVDVRNKTKYGIFATNEFQSRQFSDVMGALYRVNQQLPRRQYVVVPKETRERIYSASPTFAELRPSLESPGQNWTTLLSCQYYQVCTDNDVVYGWFIWEIRGAAGVAGHGRSALELAQFFEQIASEINSACASGRLSCRGKRSSVIPPWDSRLAWPLLLEFWNTTDSLIHFRGFNLQQYPSQGTQTELAQYRDLSRESNITSVPDKTLVTGWAVSAGNPAELSVRDRKGQPVEFTTRVTLRPDVISYMKSAGLDVRSAISFGFDVETPCTSGCSLYARQGPSTAEWTKVAPLDEGVKGFQSSVPAETRAARKAMDRVAIQHKGVTVYIESVTRTQYVDMRLDTPLQTKLNTKKLRILQKVGVTYQRVAPPLCVLALLLFVALLVQCLRYRALPISVLVVWLILVLLFSRTVAMAFVETFALRVSAEYMQYGYPLLLMAMGLVLLDPAAPFRARRGAQQASELSATDGKQVTTQEPST